jgi:hypothetical protein
MLRLPLSTECSLTLIAVEGRERDLGSSGTDLADVVVVDAASADGVGLEVGLGRNRR